MTGIYMSYKSDYPNQVHQMNLSISQNHYLLKNGDIKYQQKKFDVNWRNYENSGKHHIVNFLIRDHFSNCFYAEIHPIDEMPSVMDFLFNAWRQKDGYEFCGLPKNLIIGKHIIERCSQLNVFSKNVGMNIEIASNGFATGVRSLRDWENSLRFYHSIYTNCKNIYDFQANSEFICRDINLKDSGKTEPNLLKWSKNMEQASVINDKAKFDSLCL